MYCGNNPIDRVDLSGDFWESPIDVITLGASIIEVAVNPTDIWAWAGLVGDAVDLLPFVTGVGEMTRAVKTVSKAVDKTDDIADIAKHLRKTDDLVKKARKATGSYEIIYSSGKNYVGKGSFDRAVNSAIRNANYDKLTGVAADPIKAIRWKSAPNSKAAFIDEYLMQRRAGGVLSYRYDLATYNQIWSPGRNYYVK